MTLGKVFVPRCGSIAESHFFGALIPDMLALSPSIVPKARHQSVVFTSKFAIGFSQITSSVISSNIFLLLFSKVIVSDLAFLPVAAFVGAIVVSTLEVLRFTV